MRQATKRLHGTTCPSLRASVTVTVWPCKKGHVESHEGRAWQKPTPFTMPPVEPHVALTRARLRDPQQQRLPIQQGLELKLGTLSVPMRSMSHRRFIQAHLFGRVSNQVEQATRSKEPREQRCSINEPTSRASCASSVSACSRSASLVICGNGDLNQPAASGSSHANRSTHIR